MIEIEKEKLKKMFPHLFQEIVEKKCSIKIDEVEPVSFDGYEPTVIDFIRRCDTEEQALEVIDYLERRGEIDKEYAEKLRNQVKTKGVRSFGPKKEDDYYLKMAGYR